MSLETWNLRTTTTAGFDSRARPLRGSILALDRCAIRFWHSTVATFDSRSTVDQPLI